MRGELFAMTFCAENQINSRPRLREKPSKVLIVWSTFLGLVQVAGLIIEDLKPLLLEDSDEIPGIISLIWRSSHIVVYFYMCAQHRMIREILNNGLHLAQMSKKSNKPAIKDILYLIILSVLAVFTPGADIKYSLSDNYSTGITWLQIIFTGCSYITFLMINAVELAICILVFEFAGVSAKAIACECKNMLFKMCDLQTNGNGQSHFNNKSKTISSLLEEKSLAVSHRSTFEGKLLFVQRLLEDFLSVLSISVLMLYGSQMLYMILRMFWIMEDIVIYGNFELINVLSVTYSVVWLYVINAAADVYAEVVSKISLVIILLFICVLVIAELSDVISNAEFNTVAA